MDASHTIVSKQREFFRLSAPISTVVGIGGLACKIREGSGVVLDLQRRDRPVRALVINNQTTPVIPFPAGMQTLVQVATNAPIVTAGHQDSVTLLLPRLSFDKVADDVGARRLSTLTMERGGAASDPLMRHLGSTLAHAVRTASPALTIDRIGDALSLHIAQRYGGLRPPQRQAAGGLAPWQLRLARNTIEDNLDGSIALEDLAYKCGLSTSHFCRAFATSTGLAPHRWITRRRVDVAKDMISSASMPLAQVAVACGFSDQSHFTRMFAALNGVTPGRWRAAQEQLGVQAG